MKRFPSLALVCLVLLTCLVPLTAIAQPTGVQTVIIRPNQDVNVGWSYPVLGGGTSGNLLAEAFWYNDGYAYVSGSDVNAYHRIAIVRFDISSIPAGSTINEVKLNFYNNYATASGPMDIYACPYWSGSNTSGTSFTAGQVSTYTNDGSYTFQVSVGGTTGWKAGYGSSSTWQTQFDSYGRICLSYSGWHFDATGTSYEPRMNDQYVNVNWTSPATSHYAQVDETTAGGDSDTTYVSTSVINTYDDFGYTNVPTGITGVVKSITSVNIWAICRNGGGGTVTVRAGFYISSTYYSQISTTVGNTYTNLTSGAVTTNPATSNPWTLSDIQGLQTRMYTQDNKELRVTQIAMLVTVNYGWIPTFTSTPPTAPHTGYWWPNDAYSYTVTLNESASLTCDSKPSFLTWTAGNSTLWGRLSSTITTQTASVSFYADSTAGLQRAWHNYSFNIQNTAPTFTSSPVTTCSWNIDYYYDANATDAEGITIVYARTTDWSGLTIDSGTGILGRTKPHTNGTYTVSISASDGINIAYQNFSVLVHNEHPYFTSTPDYSVTETFEYTYTPSGTDPEGTTVTYGATEYPAFLTWAAGNHTLWGTPAVDTYLGGHSIKLTVYDGEDYGYQNYTLTVNSVWSATFTSSPVLTGTTGDAYYYDVDTNETCTFSLARYPSYGITPAINSGTGIISGTLYLQYAGNVIFDVSATNSRGKVAHQNFTVLVTDNDDPDADAGADRPDTPVQSAFYFDGDLSFDWVDTTWSVEMNYTWTFTDGTPQTVYGVYAYYTWQTLGAHTVTLTVRDAAGNDDTDTVLVTVVRAYILRPIADDYTTNWAFNGATPGWDCINELTAGGDGNTSYLSRSGGDPAVIATSQYEMSDFSALPPEDYWIQVWVLVYHTSTGYYFDLDLRNGTSGVEYASTSATYQSYAYTAGWRNISLNLTLKSPGVSWTSTDLNNLEVNISGYSLGGSLRVTQLAILVWTAIDVTPPSANIQYAKDGGSYVEAGTTLEARFRQDYLYVGLAFRSTGSYIPSYSTPSYSWTLMYESNSTVVATSTSTSLSVTLYQKTTYVLWFNLTTSQAWGAQNYSNVSIDPLIVRGPSFQTDVYIVNNIMGFVAAGAFLTLILVVPVAIFFYKHGEDGIRVARNAIIIALVCIGLLMAAVVF